MTKTVFTVKADSIYDDLPERQYHFPRQYLRTAENAVGDWVVYYEPSRGGGRKAYFATAKVTHIERDSNLSDHYYAYVSDYLAFTSVVPFREDDNYYESRLRRQDGRPNLGVFQRSVRSIPDYEFSLILSAGFRDSIEDRVGENEHGRVTLIDTPDTDDRRIIQRVENRLFRDAAFAKQVKIAYNHSCSISGLKLVNGGGRSEVQAAHIRPVSDRGPDSVRNGLALSGTIHWMFDRGLISIDDDYTVLEREAGMTGPILNMFNPERKLHLPVSRDYAPHPTYLKYHRDEIFKG